MPSAIEVRKVPIHSVADASELAKLIDDGVMEAGRVIAIIGKTEGNGGVNDYTRIIADRAFREVLVDKGAARRAGQAGPDRVVRRHRRRDQPARDDLRDHRRRADRRAAADRRLRDERAAAARGHRPDRDDEQGRRRREGRDGAGRHHRPRRRALRADQDPAADHPHDPRREVARQDRVDRAHPRVDGPLQRLHRARHRRRPGRDRDADRRGRHARPLAVLRPWPPAPRASSSTRRRSSWSATRRASAAATASATR